jgi:hypothetical protein
MVSGSSLYSKKIVHLAGGKKAPDPGSATLKPKTYVDNDQANIA